MVTPKRWVVPAGHGHTVREMLVRGGADARAVADGRVFVGRKRIGHEDVPVNAGDVVEVAPVVPQPLSPVVVLERTEDLVAVEKPAGIPTIADHAGSAHSLASRVALALGIDPAHIHATSRLDREVSGVVVFALSRQAATRLAEARASGQYKRRYLAIAQRAPEPAEGAWTEAIGRAKNPRLRKIRGQDPAPACTYYTACGSAPGGSAMLAIVPATGRTHQIRVHAAHAGAPLLGDRAYGGPARIVLGDGRVIEPRRIALHAYRVVVPGQRGPSVVAVAPVPPELRELWSCLGGQAHTWDLSTSCTVAGS